MEQAWLMIGVGVLGLFVGASAALAFRVSERSQRGSAVSEPENRVLDDDVAALLAALRSLSVLVGPSGEVIRAAPGAYTDGLVRSGRLAHPPLEELVERVRRSGSSHDEQMIVPRSQVPGSDRLAFDVRAAPLTGGRVLVLAEDRTAERRVEEVRRDFVANVSHELKTPVGAIALLAETAADAAEDPEAVRRFAAGMQRETARLSALVQEIIELSRLQAPEHEVDFVQVPLEAVVAEAVDRVAVEAQARDVTIVVGGQEALRVQGDHALLVTALRNLLDNALRYSPTGTRVSVGMREVDGIVEVAVVDQGVGLSAEDASRVFERFYRVDPARSRETGGTGLGLSIVKHVAANHGGEVRVWSTPGRGSTFTLRIPLADPEPAPDPSPQHPANPIGPAGDGAERENT
ncbi:ATP-binding protein [Ruania suaedae]|uniref:sensor histidine kinase n=1 Tax=Ruania suaedae TaxID=2897774 RepID=UPI001E45658F|nr:ATP-binding protein [Ruania suaedae]UFU03516.1 ATP-binding protein [Ruania suaedae]